MRISDWSSDVCSSDLLFGRRRSGLGSNRLYADLSSMHAGAMPSATKVAVDEDRAKVSCPEDHECPAIRPSIGRPFAEPHEIFGQDIEPDRDNRRSGINRKRKCDLLDLDEQNVDRRSLPFAR